MSQIQNFGTSGGGGGGPILTLTDDFDNVVTPVAGNINIFVEKANAKIQWAASVGSALAGTMEIVPLDDVLTTTDANITFFPFAFAPIGLSQSVVMTATVIGNKDDFSAASGGFCIGVVRREADGTVSFVGTSPLGVQDSGTGDPVFGILNNGNTIGVWASGVAGETWNWTCTFTYIIRP